MNLDFTTASKEIFFRLGIMTFGHNLGKLLCLIFNSEIKTIYTEKQITEFVVGYVILGFIFHIIQLKYSKDTVAPEV